MSFLSQQCNMPISMKNLTKEKLLNYFENTWNEYDWLWSCIIENDSYYVNPDPLRKPLIFYVGHTAGFYINKLVLAGLIEESERINEAFDVMFAIGVDPSLDDGPQNLNVYPPLEDVWAYREDCKKLLLDFVENRIVYPVSVKGEEDPLWSFLMGLEHDRIHFDTSVLLLRQLPVELVRKPEGWVYAESAGQPLENKMISVEGGSTKLGKPKDSDIYGWDCEFGEKVVEVKPFEASANMITNAEYLEFYNSGGFDDPQYWCEESLVWKAATNSTHPKFWVPQEDGSFSYRAMFDVIPMPLDFPIEVNHFEALAYCRWKGEGYRLLSEGEYHIIAHDQLGEGEDSAFLENINSNFKFGSPTPVGHFESNTLGFNDLFGNLWERLNDCLYPLPGYQIHYLYVDFSEEFMDNEHPMLVGGAWSATGTSSSKYYRNYFRKYFYQNAGFRLARDL